MHKNEVAAQFILDIIFLYITGAWIIPNTLDTRMKRTLGVTVQTERLLLRFQLVFTALYPINC